MCSRTIPRLGKRMRFSAAIVPELIGFGKWAAGYRVAGTLMSSFDRFVLAVMTSMTALSYYVVPSRILNKLRIFPGSVARVLFPAMSYSLADEREKSRLIFERSAKVLLLFMFPVTLILVSFAYELLSLWVGAGFAAHSSVLLQWLAVAAFLYALGCPPDELLWAAHRPDLTVKLRTVELPLYLALMFAMVYWRGAEGAAIACAVRCGAEAAAGWIIARIVLPDVARGGRRLGYFAIAAGLGLAVAAVPSALPIRIAIVATELLILSAVGWRSILDREERSIVIRSFRRLSGVVAVDRGEAA
jgi:O-antigen/teichoic acid export membrane protein